MTKKKRKKRKRKRKKKRGVGGYAGGQEKEILQMLS